MTRPLRTLSGLLLCLLVASAARAAVVEGVMESDFGRVVVAWEEPVTIATERRGETVELRASRPFPREVEARTALLGPLLATARLDETATALELQPAPGVTVETAILDNRTLIIGLSDRNVPELGLRLGRHAAFERIVIEPVREQHVQLRLDSGRVTATLPGRLAAADRSRLKQVAGIERVAVAGNQLFLDLAPGVVVRPLFVGPDRQVLDVYPAADAARTAGPPSTAPRPPDRGATAALLPGAAETAARATATDPPPAPPSIASPPLADAVAAAPLLVPPPWTSPSFPALTVDAARPDGETLDLRFIWPEPVPAAVFVRGDQLWVAFAAEHGGITLDAERFSTAARHFVTALREESRPGTTLLRLGLVEATTVRVDRDGGAWHVRLAPRRAELDASSADRARPSEAPTGGIFLAPIDAVAMLADPVVGDRLGIGMALDATGPTVRPTRYVGLRLQPAAQGAVWQQLGETLREPRWTASGLYLGAAEGVVRTGTGSPLPIAPAPLLEALPLALDAPATPYRDATDRPVEAAQGSPMPPVDPSTTSPAAPADLASAAGQATSMPGSAVAVGETGSVRGPAAAPEPPEAAAAPTAGPLDLARFRADPERRFWDERSRLLQAAETAGGLDQPVVELELARLHVANGLGPEAVSILATLPAPGPLDGPAAEWRALKGAALFLTGRHSEALQHLRDPALRADDETALWRGAALAAVEDWDAALAEWQRGEAWLGGYATVNQAALAEHGIMLFLQTGRIDRAFALVEQTTARPLPAASAERLRELEATALERDGAIDEARAIWRDLSTRGSPDARSRALVTLTLSDLEAGRIEAEEAIDRLVADSVHWRGLRDEVAKRRRLAAVQRAAGYVEDALATLRQALAGDPPAALAAAIADDMAAIVAAVFDELAAGERSATATLLLYRRYAELLPGGPDGDARIAALAEALSDLGLDEVAIDSLRQRLAQSQVRDGGRAALGYALASLLERAGDGRGAMAALIDSTPIDAVDENLAEARRELFARIGGAAQALAADSEAPAGVLLEQTRRAFDRRDWPAVIAATARLEPVPSASGRIDPASSEIVLMAATAKREFGDHAGVDRLVAAYAERLATPSDAALLELLAGNARFRGAADEVLDKASSYIAVMRAAVAGMPSL